MSERAFLIVPLAAPDFSEAWEQLDRSARLADLRSRYSELGAQIQARLPAFEVEFLEGAGGWTVRSQSPVERSDVARMLAGLPVEVAPDERFYAA